MDSLTQAVLGASVATAIAPKGYRKRAILAGATLGTLPDLDVFMTHSTAVDDFTRHRGWSHSLFILSIVAAVLTPLLRRFFAEMSMQRLFTMVLLALVTHALLDAMTSYGTQLFYPLAVTPTFIASIFIIDPLYTTWLVLGVVAYLLNAKFRWVNYAGLAISSLYLVLGVGMQQVALNQLTKAYPDTQKSDWFVGALGASPFCWRGVNVRDEQDNATYIEAIFNVQNPEVLAEQRYAILAKSQHPKSADWQRTKWFNPDTVLRNLTQQNSDNQYISSDLRMGEFGSYFFQFSFDANGMNNSVDKFEFSEKTWQPISQNNIAQQYIQQNSGLSRQKQKWQQLARCLVGKI